MQKKSQEEEEHITHHHYHPNTAGFANNSLVETITHSREHCARNSPSGIFRRTRAVLVRHSKIHIIVSRRYTIPVHQRLVAVTALLSTFTVNMLFWMLAWALGFTVFLLLPVCYNQHLRQLWFRRLCQCNWSRTPSAETTTTRTYVVVYGDDDDENDHVCVCVCLMQV